MNSPAVLPGIIIQEETKEKVQHLPRWHVIILNDEEHSFEYVIDLLVRVFNHEMERAIELTLQIHNEGQAIVDTTSKERAQLKQEQVHAFGRDARMGDRSTGPLRCVIEPAE